MSERCVLRIITLVVVSVLLMACNKNQQQSGDAAMAQTPVIIQLNMDSQSFVQRNGLDSKRNVNRQPAGLNFYKKRWTVEQRGRVQLLHGSHGFVIEHALSVMGVEDIGKLHEGLSIFTAGAGLVSTGELSHDEARLQFVAMLHDLLHRGWRGLIRYSEPRLLGEDSYRYLEQKETYGPDPAYVPNLDRWMALVNMQAWRLYADGVFLNITLARDTERMDVNKPGAYYVSFELYSATEHGRKQFRGEKKEQWQSLWADKVKRLKLKRNQKEAALKAQGYSINTDYLDPVVHPADPVGPEP